MVSAGAGYGKTTLLAQWAGRDPRPFGWISVDGQDNDPVVLLTYAAVALQRLIPIDAGVFDALRSPGPAIIGSAVPRLGAALAAAGVPLVLVLDDVQHLQDPECLDAVSALGAAFPPGSQLALAGRAIPDIGLPRLRAQGLVVDVGVKDLQLGPHGGRHVAAGRGRGSPRGRRRGAGRQDGGVGRGPVSRRVVRHGRGTEDEAIRTFSGREQFVADYLNSELLARLSTADVRFLTRTSVLGRLSSELCDAVLRARGSARMLDRLERSNLFVLPLDADRVSYRYHHLFRDLLRSELQRREPDLVPTLIGRAAEWCEAHGLTDEAIEYAQEAGDVERVARLFVGQAQSTYGTGRAVTVERWLEWLDRRGAAERNSAVGVLGAWLCTLRGKPAEAERWAIAAERGSYQGALPDGSASIDAWLALLSAVRCQGGVERMRVDAERAVNSIPRASSWWPIALLLVGISRLLSGDADDADHLFADSAEEGVHIGAWNAAIVAFAERAVIAIEGDRWVEAAQLAESALSMVRDHRVEDYPTSGLAYAVSARVALHREEGTRPDAPGTSSTITPSAHPCAAAPLGPDAPRAGAGLSRARGPLGLSGPAARGRRSPAATAEPRNPRDTGEGPRVDDGRKPGCEVRSLDAHRGRASPAAVPSHASVVPGDRRAALRVAPYRQIAGDLDLSQTRRHIAKRRDRTSRRLGFL